uniref:Clathrin adaptor alpha/beta/gamma-adaptin appendage Ig-like subdomain domain-containing protein n=1 Tax=Rhipicephalus microplus TaxID=6941 RepID=A0A6G5AE51_RHIMP
MDIGAPPAVPPVAAVPPTAAAPAAAMDIFGGGLDSLLSDPLGGAGAAPIPAAAPAPLGSTNTTGLLGDIFGLGTTSTFYTPPKQIWLPAARGKGLEIAGTFTRRNGQIFMDMTFSNKAMQAMTGFAIQFNKTALGWPLHNHCRCRLPCSRTSRQMQAFRFPLLALSRRWIPLQICRWPSRTTWTSSTSVVWFHCTCCVWKTD